MITLLYKNNMESQLIYVEFQLILTGYYYGQTGRILNPHSRLL